MLGSVAEAVVRKCPAPVLTIHPGDDQPLAKIAHVIIPTDFSDEASHVIDRLEEILPKDPHLPQGLPAPERRLVERHDPRQAGLERCDARA